MLADKHHWARIDCLQPEYSLLVRSTEWELLPLCREEGIGVIAWSPLAGGWLSGKYRQAGAYPQGSRMTLRPEPYLHLVSDRIFAGLATLGGDAAARGAEITALAIAWVLHHPRVDAAIIGPRTVAHLDAALAAVPIALSDDDASRLANLFERVS
jgi:aryl-alcohol dehydrogenase-like predicted oxidoreductase